MHLFPIPIGSSQAMMDLFAVLLVTLEVVLNDVLSRISMRVMMNGKQRGLLQYHIVQRPTFEKMCLTCLVN
jgi:hypothetical protein